jgi:hypothetical protein
VRCWNALATVSMHTGGPRAAGSERTPRQTALLANLDATMYLRARIAKTS